jgi:hypothetical protein
MEATTGRYAERRGELAQVSHDKIMHMICTDRQGQPASAGDKAALSRHRHHQAMQLLLGPLMSGEG